MSGRNCLLKVVNRLNNLQIKASFSNQAIFPGAKTTWTEDLNFLSKDSYAPIPVYRVMDENGVIINEAHDPKLEAGFITRMYKAMTKLNVMDKVLYESQRQGRISFYMTNYGEEGTHVGCAAALDNKDVVYGQYREAGVLMWRGFELKQFIDQCFGNNDDPGFGRNMPVHYGSKELNFMTISSPLSTQMPQAVGAAYALKGKNRIVVCFFGDGAASEGDAHAAFNFAATLESPILLFCRNNGYAISTPVDDQYRGDGIASRGPSYGIHTLRVDGNDIFAVYNVTKKAKEFILKHQKPVLIEALSYRVGHHSTSDDSTAYRTQEEIDFWSKQSPINKLKSYMINRNLWSEADDKKWLDETKKHVLSTLASSEKKLKPSMDKTFTDVYKNMPKHILKQQISMKKHVQAYKDKYPTDHVK